MNDFLEIIENLLLFLGILLIGIGLGIIFVKFTWDIVMINAFGFPEMSWRMARQITGFIMIFGSIISLLSWGEKG